jgi:hypothetical protein
MVCMENGTGNQRKIIGRNRKELETLKLSKKLVLKKIIYTFILKL